MCEFCHRHGEGKKWYLSASNYAEELYGDATRRSMVEVLSPLGAQPTGKGAITPEVVRQWRSAPRLVKWLIRRHQKDVHWGQVVPLEDALLVVDMLDWVVRLPCVCRATNTGDRDARYCLGLGISALEEPLTKLFRDAIVTDPSFDSLSKEQAKELITDLDRRGAMHSVWTFKTPFVGALCNCDRDCGAYRGQMTIGYQTMFRAEYVARVNPEQCTGCRRCMEQCMFGALSHSIGQGKCGVNEALCYGCGICRSACSKGAITLLPRVESPMAAERWGL